ncbi:SET and MYND domain-containing protein 4 [Pseudolycoriella hygida]|uniref:Protein-lysine N-methyltransferase SMYD4 n=1 Tax=Pseudolycoriella hygida TaxID=35572 RepID=A0A9Q0MQA1_9DIPT|nr:SET and MYND domain-containing protein 4 [Pseudolycoriella hygida]
MEKLENCNEFDQIYSDLCDRLRKMGKATSFCQLIKNSACDLDRIAILNNECDIIPSLIKTVKKCRKKNSKNLLHARQSLEAYHHRKESKSTKDSSENDELIQLLNSALSHLRIDDKLDVLQQFDHFESEMIESLLIDGAEACADDENKLLCDIYIQRAICFYDMDDHEMSIFETLRGIYYSRFDKKNPPESLFLLLFQIASSLRQLSQCQAATNVIQFSIKLLRSSTLPNAIKSVETVRLIKLLKEIQSLSKEVGSHEENPVNFTHILEPRVQILPEVYQSVSNTLTNTSNAVQLKWREDLGRHLIATQTIPPGATLIVEHPFSWIVHPNESLLFCQNCCRKLRNVIPCSNCSMALFCSAQCLRASEAYHRFECDFMKALTSSEILGEMVLLCYRTISKSDITVLETHIREFLKIHEGRTEIVQNEQIFHEKFVLGLSEGTTLDSSCYNAVFAQTPNTDRRLGGDLLKRSFSAVVLTICLRFSGYFQCVEERDSKCNLSEDEELIAAILLRHLQGASCNAYGINKLSGDDPRCLDAAEIGGATYPIISTTNHSCNSNVYRFTIGNTCIVKALREIRCGEEILDSYGPHFASNSMEERTRHLKGQYFFTCSCSACIENWVTYSQLPRENPSLKCTKCGNGFLSKKKDKFVCSVCSNIFEVKRFMKEVNDCAKLYEAAKELLLSSNKNSIINYEVIESSIVAYANILARTQKWPCKVLIECQETLKLCWNLKNSS